VVLDTPAGVHGKLLRKALRLADKVLVPLQPSIFDMYATAPSSTNWRTRKRRQLQVGHRRHARRRAHHRRRQAAGVRGGLGLPVLGFLRPTQNYVHLPRAGLTLSTWRRARRARPGAVARHLRWLEA
jgi:chromosome partitioning protein